MSFLKISFLSLLIASGSIPNTIARHTIHVSPISGKTADGTSSHPFSNLNEAIAKAFVIKDADTVVIQMQPGTYYLDRTITIDRAPLSPVIIQGDGNMKTIISGAFPIELKTKGNMYTASVPQVLKYGFKFEQLYVDDHRAIRAKSPDKGYFYVIGSQETIHCKGTGRAPEYSTKRFTVNDSAVNELKNIQKDDYPNIVAMFYHNWDNTRHRLSYIKPDSASIYTEGEGMKPWNPIRKGSRFVLGNYREALTQAGEWFCDNNGKLEYIPHNGENTTTVKAHIPVLSKLLEVKGTEKHPVSNLVFRNLSFQHAAYVMPQQGNGPSQAAANIDAALHFDFAKNISIENCEVKHTGNYAISFNKACTDCRLIHSFLYDLGAGGVKIGEVSFPQEQYVTKRITVENNIIQKTGNVLPCGVGIAIFHSSDNRIIHNEISNLLYSAISVGWVWGYTKSFAVNNEIAYNHIHHIGWGELSDMGAVYTLGISPNTHIHHNVIHDVYSYDYGGWGLYTDEGSTGVVMENNLVYACKSGGFHQHYGKDNIIRNNIFAFGHFFQLQFTRVEKHRSFTFTNNIVLMDRGDLLQGPWNKADIDMHDNCFYSLKNDARQMESDNSKWAAQPEKHNLFTDPCFRNPYNGNFTFTSKKIARKIGFRPFDYQNAGVYGNESWKAKALIPDTEIKRFNSIILEREKNCSEYYRRDL